MSEAEGGGPHERTVGPLLPCPFCGAREGYKLRNGSTYRWWIVACAACGDEIGECRSRGNRQAPADIGRDEVADERWNRLAARAESLRAENAELRAALAGTVNVLDLLRTYGGAKYDYASSRAGTLVHVARTIDAANALLPPNAALCGPTEENGMTERTPEGPHERLVGPATENEALKLELMEAHQRAEQTWNLTLQVLTAQADDLDRLRAAMTKALERARAFDDGSDGTDGESAASVVAILSAALTPNAAGKAHP